MINGPAIACAAVAPAMAGVHTAHADPGHYVALNGAYGQWAQTNQSYHDEASVTQTWTITSSCTTYQDCSGRVTSDQGWTADLAYLSGRWKVERTLDNWEHCGDGSAAPGQQAFTFWPDFTDRTQLVGWDQTIGPSGACGIN